MYRRADNVLSCHDSIPWNYPIMMWYVVSSTYVRCWKNSRPTPDLQGLESRACARVWLHDRHEAQRVHATDCSGTFHVQPHMSPSCLCAAVSADVSWPGPRQGSSSAHSEHSPALGICILPICIALTTGAPALTGERWRIGEAAPKLFLDAQGHQSVGNRGCAPSSTARAHRVRAINDLASFHLAGARPNPKLGLRATRLTRALWLWLLPRPPCPSPHIPTSRAIGLVAPPAARAALDASRCPRPGRFRVRVTDQSSSRTYPPHTGRTVDGCTSRWTSLQLLCHCRSAPLRPLPPPALLPKFLAF